MESIAALSDEKLVNRTKNLRAKEKELLNGLLLYLGELDQRKLYRDEGYNSFFAYLEAGLGYSKASAYRRVEAARFLKKRPELYSKLTSGELSFSSLVELSKCAEQENLAELLEKSAGKSLAVVSELVQRETAPITQRRGKEKVRVVKYAAEPKDSLLSQEPIGSAAEPNYEIVFQADEEFMKLYREAKALAGGHSMKDVFKKLLQDYTKRKSPKERIKRRKARDQKVSSCQKSSSRTRHIPVADQDEVSVRDGGRCTNTSAAGVHCPCTENLEYDHIKPYSLGGESSTDNLRLLCSAHNQLEAERVFGKGYMASKRGS